MSRRVITLGAVPSTISTVSKNEALQSICGASFVLLDNGVAEHVLPLLTARGVRHLVVPGGELAKDRPIFDAILHAFFAANLQRHHVVAVVGGGALCDVGAFASSVYMRGLNFQLFPTTLLAMVDAAIGGKTGINYGALKNMIGTFYPARDVIIAPSFLHTLSEHNLRCGLAEVIKAGMLGDGGILSTLSEHAHTVTRARQREHENTEETPWWDALIWNAANVKMNFVESDFTEKGERAFLNLGHTFAHAIEAESKARARDKQWDHGNAVGLGIRSALRLGGRLGITDEAYAKSMWRLLDVFEYPSSYTGFSATALISHMKKDKKSVEDEIRFVLQKKLCETTLQAVTPRDVVHVLRDMGADE